MIFNNIIGVISDFDEYYLGLLKGFILSKDKNVNIIELGKVENYNVFSSIFFLITGVNYFSRGTLFVVLVDPYPFDHDYLLCEYKGFYILGPNNGCFSPFVKDGVFFVIGDNIYLEDNDNIKFWGNIIDYLISSGFRIENFVVYDKNKVNFIEYRPTFYDNSVEGKVFYIDRFGNIITNIENSFFDEIDFIEVGSLKIDKAVNFKNIREIGFIRGSQGFVEVVGNKKSAIEVLDIDYDVVIRGIFYGKC